jgi:hypothetical protein
MTATTRIPELRFEIPWLQGFWAFVEGKVFPAALGAGVCGLIVLGIIRSEKVSASPADVTRVTAEDMYLAQTQTAETSVRERTAFQSSTSGVLPEQPRNGIFPEVFEPKYPGKAAWGFEL